MLTCLQPDATTPSVGAVWDGLGLHDAMYSNNNTAVSVSLSGFTDVESGIDHYMWCVGVASEDDLHACHNIGLHLQDTVVLENTITSGKRKWYLIPPFHKPD